MDRKKLKKRLIFLILFIFIANFTAGMFYWYSSIWYFDMIMHFLGGFWVGLLSFYLFAFQSISCKIIFRILLFVLFVGAGWEVFEIIFYNYIAQNSFNALDTFSDIFFDLSGGVFSIFYFLKRIMLVTENTV